MEQELLTLPEHLSSHPVFSGVHVTRSLVLCVCIVDRCLSFCPFSFAHCVACSLIYGFWLPPFGIFKLFLQHNYIMSFSNNVFHVENIFFLLIYIGLYIITIFCSIFGSNSLMNYLFWSPMKTIHFVRCSWLIDIKSVRSISCDIIV